MNKKEAFTDEFMLLCQLYSIFQTPYVLYTLLYVPNARVTKSLPLTSFFRHPSALPSQCLLLTSDDDDFERLSCGRTKGSVHRTIRLQILLLLMFLEPNI